MRDTCFFLVEVSNISNQYIILRSTVLRCMWPTKMEVLWLITSVMVPQNFAIPPRTLTSVIVLTVLENTGRPFLISPEEQDRWQTPALTSCHSQLTAFPWAGRWTPNRFHLQTSGRWGTPGDRCTGRPAFGHGPKQGQQSPCQWCSDLWHSCWQHLPCLWSAVLGGTGSCMFLSWPHLRIKIQFILQFTYVPKNSSSSNK